MGDFERTFGAGADFDRIIDENNSEYFREDRRKTKNSKKKFSSFQDALVWAKAKEGANKRGNSSRLTQSFHFFMFEPIFSPVNALNQPI